jgi:hypothetical protein
MILVGRDGNEDSLPRNPLMLRPDLLPGRRFDTRVHQPSWPDIAAHHEPIEKLWLEMAPGRLSTSD